MTDNLWRVHVGSGTTAVLPSEDEVLRYLKNVVGSLCNLWYDKPNDEGRDVIVTAPGDRTLWPVYMRHKTDDGKQRNFVCLYANRDRARCEAHADRERNNIPTGWEI